MPLNQLKEMKRMVLITPILGKLFAMIKIFIVFLLPLLTVLAQTEKNLKATLTASLQPLSFKMMTN